MQVQPITLGISYLSGISTQFTSTNTSLPADKSPQIKRFALIDRGWINWLRLRVQTSQQSVNHGTKNDK